MSFDNIFIGCQYAKHILDISDIPIFKYNFFRSCTPCGVVFLPMIVMLLTLLYSLLILAAIILCAVRIPEIWFTINFKFAEFSQKRKEL